MIAAVTPTPAVLYSVAIPLAAFDTQIRLAGDSDIPHDPTRFGSVLSATPPVSATRLCCTKFVAAKAGAAIRAAAKTRVLIDFFQVCMVYPPGNETFAATRIFLGRHAHKCKEFLRPATLLPSCAALFSPVKWFRNVGQPLFLKRS